ncbi:MAG TPA: hypothetical protein VIC25_07135 [Caulobacteraceae bacterium]
MRTLSPATMLFRYGRCESGASASEYALLLMILSGCGIVILHAMGHRMNGVFNRLAATMAGG